MNCKSEKLIQTEKVEEEFDIRKVDFKALSEVNPLTVDRATLVDINDVVIDTSLPKLERMISFVKQIRNPYCYKQGKMIVKLRFNENGPTLEESLISHFKSLI